jgi:cysteine desulfurase
MKKNINQKTHSDKMGAKVYLDFASGTKMDIDIVEKMCVCQSNLVGNPSSMHYFGRQSLDVLDEARSAVASFLEADPLNIVFCGSATEANNLALSGFVKKWEKIYHDIPEIITSAIEHESVLETLKNLSEQKKIILKIIKPQRNGVVSVKKIVDNISSQTALISLMYVNNETGAIQDVIELGSGLKKINLERKRRIFFHSDGVQAIQFLDANVQKLGVDFFTLSAQKIYGPKGVGALYVRDKSFLDPIILGGAQEFNLRSGTENVCGALGLAEALKKINSPKFNEEREKIKKLRENLAKELLKIKGVKLNTVLNLSVPSILNVMFSGVDARDLLVALDLAGFAVSVGSACSAKSISASHVLTAMGLTEREALSSLRISIGKTTTQDELSKFLEVLKEILNNLRKNVI